MNNRAIEGEVLSTEKFPYCGQIEIYGYMDEDRNITDWQGDTGGNFERDFKAKWTINGYKVTWLRF